MQFGDGLSAELLHLALLELLAQQPQRLREGVSAIEAAPAMAAHLQEVRECEIFRERPLRVGLAVGPQRPRHGLLGGQPCQGQ